MKKKIFSIRLEEKIYKLLKKIASERGRHIGDIVREAIYFWLKMEKEKDEKQKENKHY